MTKLKHRGSRFLLVLVQRRSHIEEVDDVLCLLQIIAFRFLSHLSVAVTEPA